MRTRVGWGVEDFCRWVGALNFVLVLLSLQSPGQPGFQLSGRGLRGSGVEGGGQLCMCRYCMYAAKERKRGREY